MFIFSTEDNERKKNYQIDERVCFSFTNGNRSIETFSSIAILYCEISSKRNEEEPFLRTKKELWQNWGVVPRWCLEMVMLWLLISDTRQLENDAEKFRAIVNQPQTRSFQSTPHDVKLTFINSLPPDLKVT